ncbi:hypothetical protein DFA_10833 [Cavenderia fasciculata]|uniref:Uncharacterized protein n=1 Tax=Cavenderia fasciculata TaxID=261658 RepID=F4QBI7_CACFS|nr:uncharacterized protein DFA_10833 [Cavenderia fasciculata]EGG14959.1 hypothetical protein DFA_10833 [Cavenderia fasciculata]|eukprot:XP_004351475.1 hypothetical protein DFA_10833 [Cavenderia fasciculata]
MAGKRGRPPKHKPLNTGDRQPAANEVPPLSPTAKNESLPKLLLPSTDILKKIISSKHIENLITKYDNHNKDDNDNGDDTTSNMMIDETDLTAAIKDVNTFKQYITNTKLLLNEQIDKLNQYKDQQQEFIVQRLKYNTLKKQLKSLPQTTTQPTTTTTTTTTTSSPLEQQQQQNDQSTIDQKVNVSTPMTDVTTTVINSTTSEQDDISEQSQEEGEEEGEEEEHSPVALAVTAAVEGGEQNTKMAIEESPQIQTPSTPTIQHTSPTPPVTTPTSTTTNNNQNNNINTSSTSVVQQLEEVKQQQQPLTLNNSSQTTPNLSGRLRKKPKHHDEIDDIDIGTMHEQSNNVPSSFVATQEKPKVMKLTELDNSDLLVDDQTVTSESDSSFPTTSTSSSAQSKKTSGKKRGNHTKRKGPKDHEHKKKSHHENEQQPKVHYVGPNVFWAAMDSYFRNITDADLELITPKGEENYTTYLLTPQLGSHYTEVWTNEDQERIRHNTISRQQHRSSTNNLDTMEVEREESGGTSSELNLGDLSIRLLSCLIDENILSTTSSNNSGGGNSFPTPKKPLLPSDPIIIDYNTTNQLSIEERIQRELLSLGFYDDYHQPNQLAASSSAKNKQSSQTILQVMASQQQQQNSFEDDEICAELRYIQSQLRDQVNINNQLKSQALSTCTKLLSKQKEKEKKQSFISNAEKNYQKFIKRDRKKKKLVKSNS